MAGQLAVEQLFYILAALGPAGQNADGNFSWTFFTHVLIMDRLELDARNYR